MYIIIFDLEDIFGIDYLEYVRKILHRKHCEMPKNTVNKGFKPYFYTLKGVLKMNEFEKEVRQIMIEKLKEMSEIEPDNCLDSSDYATICSVMNNIAKTLLKK